MKNKNKQKMAEIVCKITYENYVPGRHDKCKSAVYRNILNKMYPMSSATFFRYLKEGEKYSKIMNNE
ncbi:MAG: hypothetical protein LBT04_06510 [Prevotellaceae bacterium]|jgi:hypothetical protein|nr:hypothetical protein [Prevotellaceae bacterium]